VNYKFIATNLLQAKFEENKIKIKNFNYNFRISDQYCIILYNFIYAYFEILL